MHRKDKNTLDMFGGEHAMAQARRETMDKAKQKGTECPCCGQFVKVYRRTINSTMARQLITAHGMHAEGWFHTRDVVLADSAGAGDFSKLECWGLIYRQPHVQGEEGKRTSGMWKITDKGRDFIAGRVTVPQYAYIYNGNLLELGGVDIHIEHALGKKFDYREIMGWVPSQVAAGRVI